MPFRETAPSRYALFNLRRDLPREPYPSGWSQVSASPRLTAEECRDEHLCLKPPLAASMRQDMEPFTEEISSIGLDLAKHMLQVHRLDDRAYVPELDAPIASRNYADRYGALGASGTSPLIASHSVTSVLP